MAADTAIDLDNLSADVRKDPIEHGEVGDAVTSLEVYRTSAVEEHPVSACRRRVPWRPVDDRGCIPGPIDRHDRVVAAEPGRARNDGMITVEARRIGTLGREERDGPYRCAKQQRLAKREASTTLR